MKSDFEKTIAEALKAVHYSGAEDYQRLFAAVRDLAAGNPEECKFFLRYADDQFLQICKAAMQCDLSGTNAIVSTATNYLHDEYKVEETFAKAMADATVKAFASYGGKDVWQEKSNSPRKPIQVPNPVKTGPYSKKVIPWNNKIEIRR